MSGRYASYWNAFLFNYFPLVVGQKNTTQCSQRAGRRDECPVIINYQNEISSSSASNSLWSVSVTITSPVKVAFYVLPVHNLYFTESKNRQWKRYACSSNLTKICALFFPKSRPLCLRNQGDSFLNACLFTYYFQSYFFILQKRELHSFHFKLYTVDTSNGEWSSLSCNFGIKLVTLCISLLNIAIVVIVTTMRSR